MCRWMELLLTSCSAQTLWGKGPLLALYQEISIIYQVSLNVLSTKKKHVPILSLTALFKRLEERRLSLKRCKILSDIEVFSP